MCRLGHSPVRDPAGDQGRSGARIGLDLSGEMPMGLYDHLAERGDQRWSDTLVAFAAEIHKLAGDLGEAAKTTPEHSSLYNHLAFALDIRIPPELPGTYS